MSKSERWDPGRAFAVTVPEGWSAEDDEEGGLLLAAEEGEGLLHLVAFAQEEDDPADPAEELYVFLEDQGVELEEDEVEDVELSEGGELAYCEYLAEEEDDPDQEGATYWLMGVATAPGNLVFCNYSCPAGSEAAERESVLGILGSLRLRERPGAASGSSDAP